MECCSNIGDGIHWGDQKYLEELVEKFTCVHVCQNKGAGVAPWNIILYSMSDLPIVFYHFQSVKYITRHIINTNVTTLSQIDIQLVDELYYRYLKEVEEKKQMLESEYNINNLITHHPTDKKVPNWKVFLAKFMPCNILSTVKSRILHIHPYIINISH